MPTQRVIWIPWQSGTCDCDFFARSQQWQGARPDKNYIIVSWNPNSVSYYLGNLIGLQCEIYMRGHGVAGDPTINPTNTANNPNRILIYESIDRICQMGLKATFQGKIKFYSCFSALDGADRTRTVYKPKPKWGVGQARFGPTVLTEKQVPIPRPEGTWDPLARRGAAYFRSLGFNFCTFWGYRGVCSGEMQNEGENDGLAHRHVQPMVVNPATGILQAAGAEGRASTLRSQF